MQNNQNHTFEYINMIDIHHLNSFNKKYGWQEGNTLLQKLFSLLEQRYKENQIFRIFSDHFILLSKEPLDINIEELQNRLSSDEIELESTVYNLQKEQIHSIYDLEQLHLQDKRD
jgi:GGDEF domain-containing protein